MFSKIKESLSNNAIDLEKIFSQFDFKTIQDKSIGSVREIFRSIDNNAKADILNWISQIKNIKNNQSLAEAEKKFRIKEVQTSEVVLSFLKALLDVLINKVPVENKNFLKAGASGLGIAVSVLNIELSGLAFLFLVKALPKFLLSSQFDVLAEFIEHELDLKS